MRQRGRIALLALSALLVGGSEFSGATFTGVSANPGNTFATAGGFTLSVTMTDPGPNVRANVSLGATASDGGDGSTISSVTIQRSPAGAGPWTDVCTDASAPYACPFDTTAVADGLYDFRAVATNIFSETAADTVLNRRVDNTKPTVSITDPGANLRGTVSLDATAFDGGSGVSSLTLQRSPAGAGTWTDVCTDASAPYSCPFDTTAVSDGLYDVRAVATDAAGNQETAAVVNRRVDNTKPTVTLSDPGSPLEGTVQVGATASDGGSGVSSVTIQRSPAGAGSWTDVCTDTTAPYSCSLDTAAVADGLYDLRAVATDAAGNQDVSTVTNRRFDNVAPSVTMNDPGQYLRGTVSLTATASDSGGIASVVIQRSPAGAGTWTDVCTDASAPYSCSFDTAAVADGLYDLRALATDNANRTSSSTVASRRVDNTPPFVTMDDPGPNLRATVALTASVSDPGGSGVASVVIQRSPAGAGTWTDVCTDTSDPYSCSFDTTTVADGLYDVRAVATDNAGGSSASSVTNRRVDNAAPSVTMNDPGAYLRATVSLTASASDPGGSGVASVLIQRSPAGAGTWTDVCTDTSLPYSCSFDTTTVADGLYDFRAVGTDAAGNQATSVVTSRRVDNTSPTGTDVQATNVTGQTGLIQNGDYFTFTFSEQLSPGSVLAGWNGASTAVVVRIDNNLASDRLRVFDAANTTLVQLTSATGLNLNTDHTVAGAQFNATMVQSGSTITVTIGTTISGTVIRGASNVFMTWTPSALATDLAGNTVNPALVTESGVGDRDPA